MPKKAIRVSRYEGDVLQRLLYFSLFNRLVIASDISCNSTFKGRQISPIQCRGCIWDINYFTYPFAGSWWPICNGHSDSTGIFKKTHEVRKSLLVFGLHVVALTASNPFIFLFTTKQTRRSLPVANKNWSHVTQKAPTQAMAIMTLDNPTLQPGENIFTLVGFQD